MSDQPDLPQDILALLGPYSVKKPEKYQVQFEVIRELMHKKSPDKKKILVELSLLIQFGIKCFTLRDTGEILFYNTIEGVWQPGAEEIIRQLCHRVDNELSIHNLNEVTDKIRRMTYGSRNLFVNNPHLALNNCVLNMETFEVDSHKPEYYLTNKLKVDYDPSAIPHAIELFLSQILPPDSISKMQEIMGYCLLPDYRFQKAFICVGEGANGKSTLLNLLIKFLDPENVSHILMQDFDKKTFASSKLYGKMAYIASDLPEKEMRQTGMFKMLTGGDRITAERKYKEPFEFVNKAKLIFSANKPPIIYDDVDAMWRRLCLIRFPYQFVGDKADTNLLEKLTTPEELSGLLNACLMALFRLKERGCFEKDEDIQKLREEYLLSSNPIQCFAEYVLEDDFDGYEPKKNVDQAYIRYTKSVLGQIPKPVGTLTKALPLLKEHITLRQPSIDGKRTRIWRGVKIRDDYRWLIDGTGGTTGTSSPSMLVTNDQLNVYIGPKVVPAVPAVPKEGGEVPTSWKENIIEILEVRKDDESGMKLQEITDQIIKKRKLGIGHHNRINSAIDELMGEGLIFSPKHGEFKKV